MKHIVAVASGKGGVGKSTVAANLAVALANAQGPNSRRVALIDVDFYGPSIPTLMGGGELQVDADEKFIPAFRYGVKYISIAFFLKNPDDAIIWRGPMFGKAIEQLFKDVNWGDIDIALVDMPPGTGDAQLSLSQMLTLSGAIVVTTPQEVALQDVRRAITMFKKVEVPVLGIVENMSGFTTPSGERFDIFGSGGGKELAKQYGLPVLAELPLDMAIREASDKGEPLALHQETPTGQAFKRLGEDLMQTLEQNRAAVSPLKIINQ